MIIEMDENDDAPEYPQWGSLVRVGDQAWWTSLNGSAYSVFQSLRGPMLAYYPARPANDYVIYTPLPTLDVTDPRIESAIMETLL